MCNLYSITTNQAAVAGLFRRMNRCVGNLPPMPGVFPDYPAPVIRNAGDTEEMILMRWGMSPPPQTGRPPVTNIRNTPSPHWRGWLKPVSRCLVPANSFAGYRRRGALCVLADKVGPFVAKVVADQYMVTITPIICVERRMQSRESLEHVLF
jgi:putative SOS response-associated peptidase YedK